MSRLPALVCLLALGSVAPAEEAAQTAPRRGILVELFTSQG